MAAVEMIAQELFTELGIKQPKDQKKVMSLLGEAAIYLFAKKDSRFRQLKKVKKLTFAAAETKQKLPSDFVAIRNVDQYNGSGVDADWTADWNVISKDTYKLLKEEGKNLSEFAYIDNPDGGDVWYIYPAVVPTTTIYLQATYYREPLASDATQITNTSILKLYVRSRFASHNPNAGADLQLFMRMAEKFDDGYEKIITQGVVRPSSRTQRKNEVQWTSGRRR